MDVQPRPKIRRAEPGDAEAVTRIDTVTRQVAFAGIVPTQHLTVEYGFEVRLPVWRDRLEADDATAVFLAVDDDEPIAYVMVGPGRDEDASAVTGEVYDLYVLPAVWGRGVGQALMSRGLEYLQEIGVNEVTLWCSKENQRAAAFYNRLGFTGDGTDVSRPSGVREERFRSELWRAHDGHEVSGSVQLRPLRPISMQRHTHFVSSSPSWAPALIGRGVRFLGNPGVRRVAQNARSTAA